MDPNRGLENSHSSQEILEFKRASSDPAILAKSDVQSRTNNASSKINNQVTSEAKLEKPLKQINNWRERDQKIIRELVQKEGFASIEKYAEAYQRVAKLSRRSIETLTHSYFLSPKGYLIPIFHKTSYKGKYSHQIADEGKIFLGKGGFKTASRIGDGWVLQVVHQKGADMSSAIAASKVEAFHNCENLSVGHYVTWESDKTGQIKEGFLVLEMDGDITGITMKDFNVEQIVLLYLAVADGLQVMHDNDWAHCDIKPENILRRGDDIILGDMDLAQNLKDLTGDAFLKGSLPYVSPELLRGECITAEDLKGNDIFSFGVSMLQTAGFSILDNFLSKPENANLSMEEQKEAYKEYMADFTPKLIEKDLEEFKANQTDKNIGDLIKLATSMIDEPSARPTIKQLVKELEYLDKKFFKMTPSKTANSGT